MSKRVNYRKQGSWEWNDELLWSKVVEKAPDECWDWTGSRGPFSVLFGAKKNGRRQMTQATRLLAMSHFAEDLDHSEIRHTCHNRWCCNPAHFEILPNHLLYYKDGVPLEDRTEAEILEYRYARYRERYAQARAKMFRGDQE